MSLKRVLLFLPLVVAVGVGVVLSAGIGRDKETLESALIGKPVPGFQLASLQDPQTTYLPDVFKGQVRLLNVWATWCPSCRVEHPQLVKLAREEGIPIIGLNYKDNRQEALKWLDKLGNPYSKVLFDPQGTFGFDLGVYGAPETYIIDADGTVRYRHVGVVDEKVWKEELAPLVARYRREG
ncbi:DsbE family thiol:disulfide interchange protein [Marinobacter mangrovi]|uniref:DsbE family thiol:disulfide interchange protein n=1 Tax=Marinobacter mangrovi TaxID=2803918 RepID=UPI00193413A5|nr:DsbE family thiol:disulfide interchange protein [Marinobacter mangrovi]